MKNNTKKILIILGLIVLLPITVLAQEQLVKSYGEEVAPGQFALAPDNQFEGVWQIKEIAGNPEDYIVANVMKVRGEIGKKFVIKGAQALTHSGLKCPMLEVGSLLLTDNNIPLENGETLKAPTSWNVVGLPRLSPGSEYYPVENIGFACFDAVMPMQENYHVIFIGKNGRTIMNIWDTWVILEKL